VRYVVARLLAAGWLLVLILGSIAPADNVQGAYVFGDFVLHAAGYFGLTVLLVFAQHRPKLIATAVLAALIGIAMEFVQGFTADRTPSAMDALANALGAAVGAGFFWLRGCFRSSSPT
jgi:VanZ family protein